ncbi:MAG: hypothetical protein AB7P49_04630 [Bdellovibrionales bacterium]
MEDVRMDGPGLDTLLTSSLTGLLLALVFCQFFYVVCGLVVVSVVTIFIQMRDYERPVSLIVFELTGYAAASILGVLILDSFGECTSIQIANDALPVCAILSYNIVALWWPSRSRYERVFRWAPAFSSGIVKVAGAMGLILVELLFGVSLIAFTPLRWQVTVIGFSAISATVGLTMLLFTAVTYNLRSKSWIWPENPSQGILLLSLFGLWIVWWIVF